MNDGNNSDSINKNRDADGVSGTDGVKATSDIGASGEQQGTGMWNVFKSVGAAFFGVQSADNRERDFKHGKVSHFIVAGIIATGMFIGVIWGVVWLILHNVS